MVSKENKMSDRRMSSQAKPLKEKPVKDMRNTNMLGQIKFSGNETVELKGDLKECMQSMWTQQKGADYRIPPSDINIHSLKLCGLNSLSRPDKRKMLHELANKKYGKRRVNITGIGSDFGKTRKLSLAAVLVLHVGLHKFPEEYNTGEASTTGKATVYPKALFAELVGCADADTMQELSYYLRPPLMTLEKLPDFIHCAVRQIARSRKEERSNAPVALAIQTVNAISVALEQLKKEIDAKKKEDIKEDKRLKAEFELKQTPEDQQQEEIERRQKERKERKLVKLKDLLKRTLSKAQSNEFVDGKTGGKEGARKKYFSRDLGCLAGLLLAGVQRYIFKAKGDVENKKEMCDLFIDASAGLLTGIPGGGFVFGSVGSIVKYAIKRWHYDDEQGQLGLLSRTVKQHFDESIVGPIFFDGVYAEEAHEGGNKEPIEVDWNEFSKWYDQVIAWNMLPNEGMA